MCESMSNLTPRRSARIQEKDSAITTPKVVNSSSSLSSASKFPTSTMALRRSPFQPTSLELALLALYPIVLVTGSVFALLDPATRASPYSGEAQAHVASSAPSYFARKSNLFNQIFVKRGWFWVTISYFFFLFTHPSTGPRSPITLTPKRIQGFVRWAVVTTWWVFVTQWFFGPAIVDRGFTLTGGACELVRAQEEGKVDMTEGQQFVTGMACKAVGGKWKGGHDISGHVFLLVLGSMFLFEEVLFVILREKMTREERIVVMGDGAVKNAEVEASITKDVAAETSWDIGVKVVLGVAGLSIWMLLMTAAYFHTWFEKV